MMLGNVMKGKPGVPKSSDSDQDRSMKSLDKLSPFQVECLILNIGFTVAAVIAVIVCLI